MHLISIALAQSAATVDPLGFLAARRAFSCLTFALRLACRRMQPKHSFSSFFTIVCSRCWSCACLQASPRRQPVLMHDAPMIHCSRVEQWFFCLPPRYPACCVGLALSLSA